VDRSQSEEPARTPFYEDGHERRVRPKSPSPKMTSGKEKGVGASVWNQLFLVMGVLRPDQEDLGK